MKSDIKIGKIFGIDIDLHYTWFIIAVLLAWGLASGFFPQYYPNLSTANYWIIGILSAILLFMSVLAHELMHSIVAKRFNMPVEKITLFFFGGVASISDERLTPKKEFFMAAAGPVFSLLLALFFWIILQIASSLYIQAISFYLFRLNIILGLFNLAPGYPLDGGRILRSILWYWFKDIKKATYYAAYSGRIIAILLIIIGAGGMLIGLGTIWFALLGMFLYFLAGISYDQVILKQVLSKIQVKKIIKKDFISVDENLSIAGLFSRYLLRFGKDSFLVTKNKKFAGLINYDCLTGIPKTRWNKVKVKDIMIPASKIKTAKPDDNAYSVLIEMSQAKTNIIPVIKNKELIGIIDTESLVNFTRLHKILRK